MVETIEKLRLKQDLLGRAPLARSIFEQISKGSSSSAYKLAILGAKGCGKTTLINFVEELAEENKLIFIRFNPEGKKDANQLWRDFYFVLMDTLQKKGLDLKFAFPGHWWKRLLPQPLFKKAKPQKLNSLSKELDHYIDPSEADSAEQLIRGQLYSHSPLFDEIEKLLQGKKIIMVVDGLTKGNSPFVPQLIHALKSFLNLSCFSFMLSLDEDSEINTEIEGQVGPLPTAVLLGKIADQLVQVDQLAEADATRLFREQIALIPGLNEFDVDVSALGPYLPKNMQQLLGVISDIKLLKTESLYPRDIERSWQIIILCSLLKEDEPIIFKKMLTLINDVDYLKVFTLEKREQSRAELDEQITKLLKERPALAVQKEEKLKRLLEGIIMNYSQIRVQDSQLYSMLSLMLTQC